MNWLTRRRLNVPQVHALLHAQNDMLNDWAETLPESPERGALWTALHRAGDDLRDITYGGPTLWMRWRYWIRPFDSLADRRRWKWQLRQPCYVIDLEAMQGDDDPAVRQSARQLGEALGRRESR